MSRERFFLDTSWAQAFFNRKDQHHAWAMALAPRLRAAREVWTTEAILIEIGNALGGFNRQAATDFIRGCYEPDSLIRLVRLESTLIKRAVDLYAARPDKDWGLTDCLSFVVMQDQGLTDAITSDHHFTQAGFRALLLEKAGES